MTYSIYPYRIRKVGKFFQCVSQANIVMAEGNTWGDMRDVAFNLLGVM